jgi:nitroimidazol reductase NimA-like FMN-containing flavoprotein (pyridoxamine 5'-phosphate oxidase superfamily)
VNAPVRQDSEVSVEKPLPEVIKSYLAAAPVCRIATVRPNGEPHVIPVCPVYDGDATVYVDLDPHSATGAALRREPRIAVLIDDYYDDWSNLRKLLLHCHAERVEGPEQEAAWDRIREKFPQHKSIGWEPRLTMALRIRDWLSEGFRLDA